MKTVKQIPHPQLASARRLKPIEMNSIRLLRQHTVLTPEQLAAIAAKKPEATDTKPSSASL